MFDTEPSPALSSAFSGVFFPWHNTIVFFLDFNQNIFYVNIVMEQFPVAFEMEKGRVC